MAPILGPDGRPLAARGWFDTESIAEDGGTLYVGIERVHQIVRFNYGQDGLLARGQPIAVPPTMRSLPSNRGIEALVFVPKSSAKESSASESSAKESSTKKNSARERLAAKEDAPVKDLGARRHADRDLGARLDKAGNINAFLIGGSSPGSFTVKRSASYDISDAALLLPGGDLLLLERRFSWTGGLAIRMRRIALADIKPTHWSNGAILFEADLAMRSTTWRGLSVQPRRHRRGRADARFGRQFLDHPAHPAAAVSRWPSRDRRMTIERLGRRRRRFFLSDLALEIERLLGQFVVLRLHEKGIEDRRDDRPS